MISVGMSKYSSFKSWMMDELNGKRKKPKSMFSHAVIKVNNNIHLLQCPFSCPFHLFTTSFRFRFLAVVMHGTEFRWHVHTTTAILGFLGEFSRFESGLIVTITVIVILIAVVISQLCRQCIQIRLKMSNSGRLRHVVPKQLRYFKQTL